MINKQNLWFLTLFSLIMVLSIYYLTMSDDTLSTLNVNSDISKGTDVVISEENDTLVALKVQDEEELLQRMEELQNILLSDVATLQEKNDAYEELQTLNKTESEKEVIVKLIKDQSKSLQLRLLLLVRNMMLHLLIILLEVFKNFMILINILPLNLVN